MYTGSGNVKCNRHFGKQYRVSPKKLKIEISYDPAIPCLGINSKEMKAGFQVYHSIFHNSQNMEKTQMSTDR